MSELDQKLDRLLRAAQRAPAELAAPETPFGFDTRIVAEWRSAPAGITSEMRALTRLIRRIAIGAGVVATIASAAAYWQFNENESAAEPLTNSYAFADTAIDSTLAQ